MITTPPKTSVEQLRDLPARTLSRRVGCIMHSSRPEDAAIAELICDAYFDKRAAWTSTEVAAHMDQLRSCEAKLCRWLTTTRLANAEAP